MLFNPLTTAPSLLYPIVIPCEITNIRLIIHWGHDWSKKHPSPLACRSTASLSPYLFPKVSCRVIANRRNNYSVRNGLKFACCLSPAAGNVLWTLTENRFFFFFIHVIGFRTRKFLLRKRRGLLDEVGEKWQSSANPSVNSL